jgi:predicted ABC-type transport system involved in lysophospholipase L1 biosynthesis ATPase subunit
MRQITVDSLQPVAPSSARGPVVSARGLKRRLGQGAAAVTAVDGVDIDINAGTSTAIVGASGSGKTTLLQLLGLIDTPDAGSLCILGHDVLGLGDGARTRLRQSAIGIVFQQFHLLPHLTALENVLLPAAFGGPIAGRAKARALALLERVGLAGRAHHRPAALSVGEQQRVAIARALLQRPALLLADEPTANLDSRTGASISNLLMALTGDGTAVVIVTHDHGMAERAQRRLPMRDGRLQNA